MGFQSSLPKHGFVLALVLIMLSPELAHGQASELESGAAVAAAWTASTGLMVGLAAIPIVGCDDGMMCLGNAILTIGGFVLTHPFIASAGVHWLTDVTGDRQPYWHSLVSQLAGDVLSVTALATAIKLAPQRQNDTQKRRMRVLVFTSMALLSLAGPVVLRPLLDDRREPARMAQLALSF